MELIYQVITQPGEADYRAYAKAHIKCRSGRRPVLSILVGVALIATAVIPWARMGFSPLYIITLAIGLGCLFADAISLRVLQNKLLAGLPATPIRQEYRFDAAGFQLRYQGQKKMHSYSDLAQALDSQDHYFLYLDRNMAYILPKADFAQGDAASFAAFLQEKGVALMQLKL